MLFQRLLCAVCLFFACPVFASPPLAVIGVAPEGLVEDLARITIVFSEGLCDPELVEDMPETVPLELGVKPGRLPAGSFQWLDPATLSYVLDQPLSKSLHAPVEITARIPRGTRALSGGILPEDHTWTIRTPPLEIHIEDIPITPKQSSVYLRSNYPLNLAFLGQDCTLLLNGKKASFEIFEKEETKSSGNNRLPWIYEVRVQEKIPLESTLFIRIGDSVQARGGGLPAKSVERELESAKRLRFLSWMAGSREGGAVMKPGEALALRFNNVVCLKDLLAHLKSKPMPPSLTEKEGGKRNVCGTELVLPFDWAPVSTYTFTLGTGLKDEFGSALAKEARFTLRTTGEPASFQRPGENKDTESVRDFFLP